MTPAARILGTSLLSAGLGIALGAIFFGQQPDWTGIAFILACVGALVGAIAGAGHEIATAKRNQA